jgi:aminoglycoside phosphotransferase
VQESNGSLLPAILAERTKDYEWTPITIGMSGARTFLLSGTSDSLYLKMQAVNERESLRQEQQRLDWLQGKLAVPKVLCYHQDELNEYLLMSEVAGIDASNRAFETMLPELMTQLAGGLRNIHDIPIPDCPYDQRLDVKLAEAKRRVEHGLVDEADFDESRQGAKAQDLFKELIRNKPVRQDLVFTHGDYCLPNIILKDGKVSGFVDWGRAGVADRYQDLALATRSIIYNFGEQHVSQFIHAYGIENIDESKLYYYQLLDEFF